MNNTDVPIWEKYTLTIEEIKRKQFEKIIDTLDEI